MGNTDTKATRRIKKFNFEDDGAHVALVDRAANAQSVLVMKSAKANEEEIQKALGKDVTVRMTIMEFLTRYLGLWYDEAEIVAGLLGYTAEDLHTFEDSATSFVDHIQEQMDSVEIQKSESSTKLAEALDTFKSKYLDNDSPSSVEKGDGESVSNPTDDNEEVDSNMSEENTPNAQNENELTIEEQIQKAAERLAEAQMEEVRKREDKMQRELDVLKAERSAQRHAKFVAKAEGIAEHLGEDADVEAIAKALETASEDENMEALVKALETLADTKSNEGLMEEVGKSATREQDLDRESKVEQVQKQLMDDEGLSESAAYVKAFDQVHEVK